MTESSLIPDFTDITHLQPVREGITNEKGSLVQRLLGGVDTVREKLETAAFKLHWYAAHDPNATIVIALSLSGAALGLEYGMSAQPLQTGDPIVDVIGNHVVVPTVAGYLGRVVGLCITDVAVGATLEIAEEIPGKTQELNDQLERIPPYVQSLTDRLHAGSLMLAATVQSYYTRSRDLTEAVQSYLSLPKARRQEVNALLRESYTSYLHVQRDRFLNGPWGDEYRSILHFMESEGILPMGKYQRDGHVLGLVIGASYAIHMGEIGLGVTIFTGLFSSYALGYAGRRLDDLLNECPTDDEKPSQLDQPPDNI